MPIKFTQAVFTPPVKNSPKPKLTPKEKFQLIKKETENKGSKVRLFHFKIIQSGKEIFLFNGDGKEITKADYSIENCRMLRGIALDSFLSAEEWKKQGGFKCDNPSFEYQTPEELEIVRQSTMRNLNYVLPFVTCDKCNLEFENKEDKNNHRCGNNWLVLNFGKPVRRIYANSKQSQAVS